MDSVVRTAAQVLWQAADRFADEPCLTDLSGEPAISVTYARMRDLAAAAAGGFTELGLAPGDRVALLLNNGRPYVQAYLGAIAAGLVVVPLNVRLVQEDYVHMLRDSGSRVLVTEAAFLSKLPDPSELPELRVVRADPEAGRPSDFDQLVHAARPTEAPVAAGAEDPATLMYTSGTTGAPKAVVLSHRSWAAVAARSIEVLGMGEREVTLHVAPLTHGAGFLLLPTLQLGGHNLLLASFDAAQSLDVMDTHGVTGLFVVPSMIRMMLDARTPDWHLPESLRRLYYAGSPIDPDTMREATEVFAARLVQSFAQMESPMFFTVLDQDDHRRVLADPGSPLVRSAGRILPGVQLRIVDDEGVDLPEGEAGEILARAPQTMTGYWNRPDSTAETLADGWLHTGDIGLLDESYLFVVDRKKDMIVSGGSNVYAREVEEALLDLPAVKEAAVIGLPHRVWGEAVTAVLVPAGDDQDSDAVIAACKARLAGYRVPKTVLWVEELPRNAYGKVLKRQLREKFGAASSAGA